MKTTYRSFGRGVAVRWDRQNDRYEVLVRGGSVFRSKNRTEAYDYAEMMLGGSGDSDGGE